jgi:hypothetical protein
MLVVAHRERHRRAAGREPDEDALAERLAETVCAAFQAARDRHDDSSGEPGVSH